MIGVNLIPPHVLIQSATRRQIRRWAAALVLLAGVVVVPVVIERRQQAQVERLSRQVADVEARLRAVRGEVSAAAQTVLSLDAELARAQALRTKRSWSGLLALISDCAPRDVWLTSFATDPAQPSGSARPVSVTSREYTRAHAQRVRQTAAHSPLGPDPGAAKLEPQAVVLEAPTRLLLDGFALNHEDLYDLMSKLKASGAFSGVTLVRAGTEPVLGGRAVHFVLTCEW